MNPYKVLNINENSSPDEIKKAYRKMAMQYHPDKNNGDDTKFREVQSAYEALTTSKKTNHKIFTDFGSFTDDFFDHFKDAFTDQFNRGYNRKGQNISTQLSINMEESYHGTSREIMVGMRRVKVNIPRGIRSGQRIRLNGLGQRGENESLNGDLIITIILINTNNLFLDDKGLHTIFKINLFDALLGGVDEIDIFGNKIAFKIPENTQNDAVLRIRGKGFPIYNKPNEYSDLYINVSIVLPEIINEYERNLLNELKDSINNRFN